MPRHDLDAINNDLADRIDELVPRFFGNADLIGNYWSWGSIKGEPGNSLKVWRKGPKQGEWCDFAAGKGGRPLKLIVESPDGGNGDFRKGLQMALQFLGRVAETEAERQAREKRDRVKREQRERERAAHVKKMTGIAQYHFLSAAPIAGTPADTYMRGRGIDFRRLGRQPGALRFKMMQCPDTGLERPCMLGAVNAGSAFLTVHRHFLFELADGRVVKADHDDVPEEYRMEKGDAKQAYSSITGGLIPIWRGESKKPLKDMPAGEWVVGTEGVEDGGSFAIAEPARRIVSTAFLNNLGVIDLPPQCGGIYWHRHRDDSPDAIRAYERQRDALDNRNIRVREIWAPEPFKDINEWLQAQPWSKA